MSDSVSWIAREAHKFVHAFRHGSWPWLGVTQLLNVYKEFCCKGRESEKVVQELKSTRIRQRCGEPVGFLRRRRCDWKSDWGYPNQNLQSARQNTDTHICEVKCDRYTCWWLLLSSLARSLCECVLKKNVCGLLFTVQIFWLSKWMLTPLLPEIFSIFACACMHKMWNRQT